MVNPEYTGNITVPVLFDKKLNTIVNNESSEIIRMLNSEFNAFAKHPNLDLYPVALREKIDEINSWVYPFINNGVYRCGFARSQEAYDEAFGNLFKALDKVEDILSKQRYVTAFDRGLLEKKIKNKKKLRYLVGEHLTEADVRLFTTLIRFDACYVLVSNSCLQTFSFKT